MRSLNGIYAGEISECRHCGHDRLYGRGLCFRCYRDKDVRSRYRILSKHSGGNSDYHRWLVVGRRDEPASSVVLGTAATEEGGRRLRDRLEAGGIEGYTAIVVEEYVRVHR